MTIFTKITMHAPILPILGLLNPKIIVVFVDSLWLPCNNMLKNRSFQQPAIYNFFSILSEGSQIGSQMKGNDL